MTPRKRNCLTTVSQVNLGEIPCYPKLYNMGLQRKRGLGVMIVPCDCAIFGVHVIYKFEVVTGTDSQKIIEFPDCCICLWYPSFIPNVQSQYPLVIKRRLLGISQPCLITDYILYPWYPHSIPLHPHYIYDHFWWSNHHFWNSKTICAGQITFFWWFNHVKSPFVNGSLWPH